MHQVENLIGPNICVLVNVVVVDEKYLWWHLAYNYHLKWMVEAGSKQCLSSLLSAFNAIQMSICTHTHTKHKSLVNDIKLIRFLF